MILDLILITLEKLFGIKRSDRRSTKTTVESKPTNISDEELTALIDQVLGEADHAQPLKANDIVNILKQRASGKFDETHARMLIQQRLEAGE